MGNPFVPVLLQGAADDSALVVAFFVAAFIVIIVAVTVGILIHRDAKRRGANPRTWLTAWILLSVFGLLGQALFAVVYLIARPKQILYDRQGNPLLPTIPPGGYQGSPPPAGWPQASDRPGYESRLQPPPPPPGWLPAPAPSAPPGWQPAPAPGYGPPQGPPAAPPFGVKASKVKCPKCHTIFEYYAAPAGPTHVKCPACGEEGNI